jgi:hypothetical protein
MQNFRDETCLAQHTHNTAGQIVALSCRYLFRRKMAAKMHCEQKKAAQRRQRRRPGSSVGV